MQYLVYFVDVETPLDMELFVNLDIKNRVMMYLNKDRYFWENMNNEKLVLRNKEETFKTIGIRLRANISVSLRTNKSRDCTMDYFTASTNK